MTHEKKTCKYHVFVVHDVGTPRLLVDYVSDDPESHRIDLLQQLRFSTDPALQAWAAREVFFECDLFEVERLEELSDAQEAVDFWRAYFRVPGVTVVKPAHLSYQPVETQPQRPC